MAETSQIWVFFLSSALSPPLKQPELEPSTSNPSKYYGGCLTPGISQSINLTPSPPMSTPPKTTLQHRGYPPMHWQSLQQHYQNTLQDLNTIKARNQVVDVTTDQRWPTCIHHPRHQGKHFSNKTTHIPKYKKDLCTLKPPYKINMSDPHLDMSNYIIP